MDAISLVDNLNGISGSPNKARTGNFAHIQIQTSSGTSATLYVQADNAYLSGAGWYQS